MTKKKPKPDSPIIEALRSFAVPFDYDHEWRDYDCTHSRPLNK